MNRNFKANNKGPLKFFRVFISIVLMITGAITVAQPASAATAQTISFTTPSAMYFPSTTTQTLSATATSNLRVAFTSLTTAICSVTNGANSTVTARAAGTCSIRANQAGNATYSAAPAVTRSFTINARANQIVTWTPTPTIYITKSPKTPSSPATSSGPGAISYAKLTSTSNCSVNPTTGAMTYSMTVANIGKTCIVRANAAQTATHNSGTSTITFTIAKTPQTITFPLPSDMLVRDADQSITRTVDSPLALTTTNNSPSVCSIVNSKVHAIAPGTCSITVSQAGNTLYNPATVTHEFTIAFSKDATLSSLTTTGTTFSPTFDPATLAYDVTVASDVTSISATPTMNQPYASLEIRQGPSGTFAPIASATASSSYTLNAGANTIEVRVSAQDPDEPKKTYTATVKVRQVITFVQPSDIGVGDPNQILDASATSGRFVTITSDTTDVCTVVDVLDNVAPFALVDYSVHAVALGTCVLRASLAANDHYAAAEDVTKSIEVTAATVSPEALGIEGPGGGTIFYVSGPSGFECGTAISPMTCHYIEAAPKNWNGVGGDPNVAWSPLPSYENLSDITNDTFDTKLKVVFNGTVGEGLANSNAIVARYGSCTPVGNNLSTCTSAAAAARSYRGGGLDDWYLPNAIELNQFCKLAVGSNWVSNETKCAGGSLNSELGLSAYAMYWSSSESTMSNGVTANTTTNAIFNQLSTGWQSDDDKHNPKTLRPIRAFGSLPTTVSVSAIPGVTAPVTGATPVTSLSNSQYTGVVTWSPAHATFHADTAYEATITLTPKAGYWFKGVTPVIANFFTVAGSSSITPNAAKSGVVKALFAKTAKAITIAAVPGVSAPVAGDTPVTTVTETAQYTGTVSWDVGTATTFDVGTVYTATITLTPKTGFTLSGVIANFFTVADADTVTNDANTGVITAVFPGAAPITFVSSGNFTIDMWIKPQADFDNGERHELLALASGSNRLDIWYNSSSGQGSVIGYGGTDPFGLSLNMGTSPTGWHNIVVTRNTGTVYAYVDGALADSGAFDADLSGSTLILGSDPWGGPSGSGNALISNVRIVDGIDLYPTTLYPTGFVPSRARLGRVAGTSFLLDDYLPGVPGYRAGDSSLILGAFDPVTANDSDYSLAFAGAEFAIRHFGVPLTDPTGIAPGTFTSSESQLPKSGAMVFTGVGNLTSTMTAAIDSSSSHNDFTYEAWVKPTTTKDSQSFIENDYTTAGGIALAVYTGSTNFLFYGANHAASNRQINGALPVGSWTHIAVVRHNDNDTFYVNGVAIGSPVGDTYSYTKTAVAIGGDTGFTNFVGNIARVRISKVARYLNTFTPLLTDPPLTSDSDTLFLLDPTDSTFVNGATGGGAMTNNGSVTFTPL